MLIFAWSVFGLSALTLFFLIIAIVMEIRSPDLGVRRLLSGFIPILLWILGCVWYIFGLTVIPYEFVIGAALGAALFYTVVLVSTWAEEFSLNLPVLTSFASLVFFALAVIL